MNLGQSILATFIRINVLIVFLLFLWTDHHAQVDSFKVFGYFPVYRHHLIDSIDLEKLTHICIGFGNPSKNGKLHFDGINIGPLVEKAKAANVKVLISLAGGGIKSDKTDAWEYWLKPWNRDKWINEIARWVIKYRLDGVDVDLEWSDVNQNYSGFIVALKDRLKRHGKILTAALPGKFRYKHLNDQALQSFDYVLSMAYDLRGPWNPKDAGQHSPYSMARNSIRFWRSNGVKKERIILGLPCYGWEFSKKSNRVYSVSYGFLVSKDSSFHKFNQVGNIYYNGLPMIEAKTDLAFDQAGGIMFWELGQDNFGAYSLLGAAHNIVKNKQADQEIILSPVEIAQLPDPKLPKDTIESNRIRRDELLPQNSLVVSNTSSSLILQQWLEKGQVPQLNVPNAPPALKSLKSFVKLKFITKRILR